MLVSMGAVPTTTATPTPTQPHISPYVESDVVHRMCNVCRATVTLTMSAPATQDTLVLDLAVKSVGH